MAKNKLQFADLIRFTAIAFSNGETEQEIVLSLKDEFSVNEADITMILLGSEVLRQGLTSSLNDLSKKQKPEIIIELPTN